MLKVASTLALAAIALAAAWFAPCRDARADVETTWSDGRFYLTSPTYYTATQGELSASFREVLPWGSRVELYYGWGGKQLSPSCTDCRFDWTDVGRIEATAVAPYTWSAYVNRALHERSYDYWIDRFQFFWIVTLPTCEVRYVRGNASPYGYFEASLPAEGTVQSVDRDESEFESLAVSSIPSH